MGIHINYDSQKLETTQRTSELSKKLNYPHAIDYSSEVERENINTCTTNLIHCMTALVKHYENDKITER